MSEHDRSEMGKKVLFIALVTLAVIFPIPIALPAELQDEGLRQDFELFCLGFDDFACEVTVEDEFLEESDESVANSHAGPLGVPTIGNAWSWDVRCGYWDGNWFVDWTTGRITRLLVGCALPDKDDQTDGNLVLHGGTAS